MTEQNNNQQEQMATQGIPSVTGKKKQGKKSGLILILLAIVIGILVLLAVLAKDEDSTTADNGNDEQQNNLTSSKSLTLPALPPEPIKEEDEEKEEAQTDTLPVPVAVATDNVQFDAQGNPLPTLEELKYAAPMMGEIPDTVNPQSTYQPPNMAELTANSDASLMGSNPQRDLSERLQSVKTPTADAKTIRNKSLILSKGTVIDCILETRVDTTVPGMTTCVIPRDIYSMDGRVLLVERGTKAIGEYQGSVANGLARIFMLWTELRTPNGVVVNINSPAADQLGAAGMGGYVDYHWWQRFGNALLFSLISDGFQYIVNTANSNNNNSNVTYESTEDGMDEIIKEAMRQSGNIPPTLIKNQGERVSIFVARDLNFEGVYKLNYRGQ